MEDPRVALEREPHDAAGIDATGAVPGELPPKEPGRHRWVAMVAYSMTPAEARADHGGATVALDPDRIVTYGVGCIDCDTTYADSLDQGGGTHVPCARHAVIATPSGVTG